MPLLFIFFFFNDTATTEIYTLSLHDALPICSSTTPSSLRTAPRSSVSSARTRRPCTASACCPISCRSRSEEHTSELQSRLHLVCRLLLEKKKKAELQCTGLNPVSAATLYDTD